jgi:Ca2+-binding EF-hand superfamily protein
MADSRRTNSVKFSIILDSMMKMMPHFTRDFVDNIPYAFQMSPSDMVSREEFDMLFDVRSRMQATAAPTSALKKKNQLDKAKPQDNFAILKYLAEVLVKENLTSARLFKLCDTNFNQVVTVEELKEQVKKSLPDAFAGLNFKKLLKAFDLNGNGLIEQDEFCRLIDMAAASLEDTSVFAKVSGSVGGKTDARRALDNAKQTGNSVTLPQTVAPNDRMDAKGTVFYLKELLACESRVSDPLDDIQMIFEKIQTWKEKAGDKDEQEKMVAKALKPKERIKIHNVKTLMTKLKEHQLDIGFTDDEINIIVYTSIDHDYFTNLLILQGEFLKWFNLDFSETSREELDFLENKQDIWMATTTLAMEVVTWFGRIQENHEVILTDKWW